MQGRMDEAVEMLDGALSIATEYLGMENLTTCPLLVDEVALYLRQGRWDDARLIAEETRPIRRKLLGDENETTMVTSWFLASIRINIAYNMGEWDNGTRILEEVLAKRRRIFGDEDVETIVAKARLEVMRESAKGFDGNADKKEVAE